MVECNTVLHLSNLGCFVFPWLGLQISDEGGGIKRSGLPKIWTYLYSTAQNPVVLGRQDQEMPNVMAGYGYGLPISRLYARYFGGDLQIISMEGYGELFSSSLRYNASVSPVDLPSQIISLVSPCTGNVVDIPLLCLYLETCMVLLLPYVPQLLILNICCLPHCWV